MLELKAFQIESAKTIADRYVFFANHPDRPRKGHKPRPFFQALSALTGAGKTPILAQAVSLMRGHFNTEPIVLWMSKARSVVSQTYTNFSRGKYTDLVDGFRVVYIQHMRPALIADGTLPLLLMTTTGLFNNKEQSEGTLNIYKKDSDLFGDHSPWDRLIDRLSGTERRPLIIVYDEGHNLSEQQTELLSELEPDAYLLASATLKLPANFQQSVIQPIKLWVDESVDLAALAAHGVAAEKGQPEAERFITTAASSDKVVAAQLVKKAIQFDGTTAAMERCLDDLIGRMTVLNEEITTHGLGFSPKVIYVCKTNIADDGERDDGSKPFQHRTAPPIRIWRYLVENRGISPKDIAIYANLTFAAGSKPDEVNLFSKGENDFDEFSAGDYQHIIFNLSLQEGWDDPACYLAYIDKSMGSAIQVEQIIGRVLRQYGATHYDNPLLNSAHFFLRVDKQSVFTEAIQKVKTKLQSEGAPIEIAANFGAKGTGAEDLKPKDGIKVALHHIFVDSEAARDRIGELIEDFPDFTKDTVNTLGEAHTTTQIVDLESLGNDADAGEWTTGGYTNPVRLRWLVNTAIKSRSSRARAILDLKHPKFDVRVQLQSKADKLADELSRDIVEAFFAHSDLVYESSRPVQFGTLRVPITAPVFTNGLYQRYREFNKFELAFAKALDTSGAIWHRNSSTGGFFIPLLSEGDTASFFPDFIVWKKNLIFCVDTKAGHLLSDAVARKLFDIKDEGKTKLRVRFVTAGKQLKLRDKVIKGGFTVWKMKSGSPTAIHVRSLKTAVTESLK